MKRIRNVTQSMNQSISRFLQWPKWCNHCKDHQPDDVSRCCRHMTARIRNVLTVDGRWTASLPQRRQLAVYSGVCNQRTFDGYVFFSYTKHSQFLRSHSPTKYCRRRQYFCCHFRDVSEGIAHWRRLADTTDRRMRGGDAA